MASLICPNCGKDNPDFLDDCQFCQTPLRREATLNIGEEPTKKSTGELEGVLPDWLKEPSDQGFQPSITSRTLAEHWLSSSTAVRFRSAPISLPVKPLSQGK